MMEEQRYMQKLRSELLLRNLRNYYSGKISVMKEKVQYERFERAIAQFA
jgi:hypothetical protein